MPTQAFAPGRGGATRAPGSEGVTRGIFLVTTFVWDVEGSVLNAARTYGLTEASFYRTSRIPSLETLHSKYSNNIHAI